MATEPAAATVAAEPVVAEQEAVAAQRSGAGSIQRYCF